MKRQRNDAIDAEAICEAAQRPGMRFVAVKTEEQQAAGMVFRTRNLLVRQRTQLINALRGHLAEYGWVAPRGTAHMALLADLLDEDEMASSLPEAARDMFTVMTDQLARLDEQITDLDREIARTIRRLLIIGGSSVVRQACRHGAPTGSWLERMLARKPRMLVSVALANKMARTVWALLTKQENYRAPATVAA